MRPLAVFDTNVLFSAYGWRGPPYRCVELARSGIVEIVTCQELLTEWAQKQRIKLKLPPETIAANLADFLGLARVVGIPGTLHFITADPTDDKVLECEVVASATHIVSGDRKHLRHLGDFRGIPILSPAEFMSLMTKSQP